MKDFSSTVSYSPSFSYYASSEFAAAAVKVSRENQSYNITNHDGVKVDSVNEEDADFEFETSPLHEESFVHFPTFMPLSNETVLMSNKKQDDLVADAGNVPEDIFFGGRWSTPHSPSPSPSPLWSESEELETLSGNCLWSPLRSPAVGDGHSKMSKRCRLKKFLTRSHSDGAVSSPSSSKRCFFKDFMKRSHSNGGNASKTSSPVAKRKDKSASTSMDEGDKRRQSYLPYRRDLIGVFAGMRRLRH